MYVHGSAVLLVLCVLLGVNTLPLAGMPTVYLLVIGC